MSGFFKENICDSVKCWYYLLQPKMLLLPLWIWWHIVIVKDVSWHNDRQLDLDAFWSSL